MFRAAISVANQYNIRVNNEKISGDVIRTNDDETGHAALNYVCQYISSKHSNVVGIVGPGSSNNARFIGPFAAHIQLPVVSYAATNADFSDKQLYPTFYRTVPSDFLLARAIVQLFELFKWKTCTLIIQKDDYGYGGLHILSEHYHQNITIKQRLTFDGKTFNANLKESLFKSLSRIVLVWAEENEATSIIERAFRDGVIGGSYVWITTDQVSLYSYYLFYKQIFKRRTEETIRKVVHCDTGESRIKLRCRRSQAS
jgi:hypothetical protein